MKYGKSKVLICEIMGFVRVFRKEQHPRGPLAKNEHFLTKLIVSKILAQLCSDDLIQILLNLTWG